MASVTVEQTVKKIQVKLRARREPPKFRGKSTRERSRHKEQKRISQRIVSARL